MNASSIKMTHAVIGANPQRAVFGLKEYAHKVVHQTFARGEVRGCLCREMIDTAAVGSDPERTILTAQHIANPHVAQSGKSERLGLPALHMHQLVGSGPQRTVRIQRDGAEIRVSGFGEGQHAHRSAAEAHHAGLGS